MLPLLCPLPTSPSPPLFSCYPPSNRPAAADTTPMVVNLLPSTTANSVTESLSTAQSSPASESTTLTISTSSPTKVAPTKSSPKNSTAPHPNSLKADPQPNVGPLVDLSDTPKVAPSSIQTPLVIDSVAPPSANADGPQSKCDSVKAPDSTQSKDLQVDGPTKDAPNALCTDSTTPAQNEYEHLRFCISWIFTSILITSYQFIKLPLKRKNSPLNAKTVLLTRTCTVMHTSGMLPRWQDNISFPFFHSPWEVFGTIKNLLLFLHFNLYLTDKGRN